jgi:hypothetical protein
MGFATPAMLAQLPLILGFTAFFVINLYLWSLPISQERCTRDVSSAADGHAVLAVGDRRFSLFCLALALGPAIEHAARNIDSTATDGRLQRRSADGTGARAGVKRYFSQRGRARYRDTGEDTDAAGHASAIIHQRCC